MRTARLLTVSRSMPRIPVMWPVMHAGKLPPVTRMTHGCKNITLPQTSFVDGN